MRRPSSTAARHARPGSGSAATRAGRRCAPGQTPIKAIDAATARARTGSQCKPHPRPGASTRPSATSRAAPPPQSAQARPLRASGQAAPPAIGGGNPPAGTPATRSGDGRKTKAPSRALATHGTATRQAQTPRRRRWAASPLRANSCHSPKPQGQQPGGHMHGHIQSMDRINSRCGHAGRSKHS